MSLLWYSAKPRQKKFGGLSPYEELLKVQKSRKPEGNDAALLQQAIDALARDDEAAALQPLLRLWQNSGNLGGDRFKGFYPQLVAVTQALFERSNDWAGYIDWYEQLIPALEHASLLADVEGRSVHRNVLIELELNSRVICARYLMAGQGNLTPDHERAERLLQPKQKQVEEEMERIRLGSEVQAKYPVSPAMLQHFCLAMNRLESRCAEPNLREALKWLRYYFLVESAGSSAEATCATMIAVGNEMYLLFDQKVKRHIEANKNPKPGRLEVRPAFRDPKSVLATLSIDDIYNANVDEMACAIQTCLESCRQALEPLPEGPLKFHAFVSYSMVMSGVLVRFNEPQKALETLVLAEQHAKGKALEYGQPELLSVLQEGVAHLKAAIDDGTS